MCCVDFEAVLRLESGNKQAHSELKMVQQMLEVRLKLAVTFKITAYFTYLVQSITDMYYTHILL